jgi:hypothetical protein
MKLALKNDRLPPQLPEVSINTCLKFGEVYGFISVLVGEGEKSRSN